MITIGIPVYNGKERLRRCLQSIFQNLSDDFKVVVCDDGSIDGTGEMVKEEFTDVVLLGNQSNLGVAYSTNRILELIEGEHFLRLDADTVVLPGSVEKLVGFMQEHPRCGVAAAGLVDEAGNYQKNIETNLQTPLFWLSEYLLWPKKIWSRAFSAEVEGTKEVEAMGSAAILVHREAIEQVGGLDEKMRFFLEDSDWVMRIKQAGWQLWYYPEARIVHVGGQSAGSEDLYIHCRNQSLESLYYFTSKHFPGWLNQALLSLSVLAGSVISLLLAISAWLPSRFNRRARIVVDRGLRSFWNVLWWHYAYFIRRSSL